MPILLRRVDERLIHGQVLVGWGRVLRPDHYLVVDDQLAESEWERDLYVLAVEDEVAVTFQSVEEARAEWEEWESALDRIIVLVRDLDTMERLARDGMMDGAEINLGGIHHSAGRVAVRPYLHLDVGDRGRIQSMAEAGLRVTGRDLPDTPAVTLDELLQG